jgi:hypothetical protein
MGITKITTNGLSGTKYDTVSADNYYMEPIATTLVGAGGAASITFSNIPQGYKHLQIRVIARGNSSATNLAITFSGDTNNANYWSRHQMYGDGATAASNNNQTLTGITCGSVSPSTTSLVAPDIVDLLDYSNVSKYKTLRVLGGYDANGSGAIVFGSGLWMNTAAITSINIAPYSGTFTQYSRFSLYGIRG